MGPPHRALPYSTPLRYFLAFLPLTVDNQPDKYRAESDPVSKSIGARLGADFKKAAEKPSASGKHLAGQVEPPAQGVPPARLYQRETHKEQIGNVGKQQLFPVDSVHLAIPLSLFFTLSRCAFRAAAFSLRNKQLSDRGLLFLCQFLCGKLLESCGQCVRVPSLEKHKIAGRGFGTVFF